MQNIFDREKSAIFQLYKRLPLEIVRGEGTRLYAADGTEYLDFLAGIAVNAMGYGNRKIISAIKNQAEKFCHVSNYLIAEPQVELAEKLKKLSGMERVFFANSGSEANEAALKLARRYGVENGKSEIIGFEGGFHGRTYGPLSVMDKPKYKDKMGPFLGGMKVINFNDVQALEENINENTAAVILEFLQGEGGVVPASAEFAAKLAELRSRFNFLIIADEVQSGCGRTGKFFACDHFGIRPDIATLAKAIGGGLPLGVMLASDRLAALWSFGSHGTTFGGNPVACAAGSAFLDELESGVMKNAEIQGSYLKNRLLEMQSEFPELILDVRGLGLMLGVELSIDASIILEKMLTRHVITNVTSQKVIRIIPPLVITGDDADIYLDALRSSLTEIGK